MTPNTSPKKPDWFALIENSAPSAQVRKVDKKLPAATAIVALAIVAFGTFFANGSINFDSSPTSNMASTSMSTVASGEVAQTAVATTATSPATQTPAQSAKAVSAAKNITVAAPQSMNSITDPTLNGGGKDDDDDDDDNDDDDNDDDDDDRD
jgi:hypothetical protein